MIARALLYVIRGYQALLSPWLGRHCRFEPSCSRYSAACIESHGAFRGVLLSIKRLCKCHPFHSGGFDPPPTNATPPPSTAPSVVSPSQRRSTAAAPRRDSFRHSP